MTRRTVPMAAALGYLLFFISAYLPRVLRDDTHSHAAPRKFRHAIVR